MLRYRISLIAGLLMATSSFTAWAADTPVANAPAVHVGDKWHYRSIDGLTNEPIDEHTQRVVEVGATEVVVQFQKYGTQVKHLHYFTREWNTIDNGTVKYDPFYPEHQFPLSVGAVWQLQYRVSHSSSGRMASSIIKGHVVAFEKVSVQAGIFEAYRIENEIKTVSADSNAESSNAQLITWYSPEARKAVRRELVVSANGRVRDRHIIELVAYSLVDKTSPGQPKR